MRAAIGLVGLAACVSAGCGRSWSDPWAQGPALEPRRCEGLLWAGNGDGELHLVDTERGSAEWFAALPVGTWALGTDASDGSLWLWEAVGQDPRLFTFDPWTGDAEVVHALETQDNMDRGGFGPDGRFWAVAVPSQTLVAYDPDSKAMTTTALPDVGAGQGGDLAAVGDAVVLAWWPDEIGVISAEAATLAPQSTGAPLGLGDVQVSGIAVTDERIWVGTFDGQFFEIGPASGALRPEVHRAFTAEVAVSDLAPVIVRGRCPGE